jgi:predicted TIM-barrel fold metal-dependent hydrolase
VIEGFGIDRCFFGGDRPVSSQAASYPTCVETLETLVAGASDVELRKLFHDNGEGFYPV